MPEPVNELALLIDEALAWEDAGQDAWAEATIAAVSQLVPPLVAAQYTGRLPLLALDDVKAAADLVRRVLPAGDPDLATLDRLDAAVRALTDAALAEIEDALTSAAAENALSVD